MSQVASQTPVSGLQVWHASHTVGTSHAPLAGLQLKQFGQRFGEQEPVAGSQFWQALQVGTHCPLTHFWHLSPPQVEHTPFVQV
jgi:hypothetical protein